MVTNMPIEHGEDYKILRLGTEDLLYLGIFISD
jgi:hypothetical protein